MPQNVNRIHFTHQQKDQDIALDSPGNVQETIHHIHQGQRTLSIAIEQWQAGKLAEAERLFSQLISAQPHAVDAYINLGRLKQQQGNTQEALKIYIEATRHCPQSAIAHKALGDTFFILRKFDFAIQAYVKALKIEPDFPEVHNNLGTALKSKEQYSVAIKAYEQAIKCKPDYIAAYCNLADVYHNQGLWRKALECLNAGLQIEPYSALLKLSYCMSQLPGIYAHEAEIPERRNAYAESLTDLLRHVKASSPAENAELAAEIGKTTPFYLAYQGLNDKDLQADYGTLLVELAKSQYPQWSQYLPKRKLAEGERIRIGFLSGCFRNHSVWKIPLRGWLQTLDRNQFEIFGYCTDTRHDQATRTAAELCDHFAQSPRSLEQWCETIIHDQLHVLVYPELSMEHINTKLACLRLAPIQLTSVGHPITSGLPTIDYYVSSDLMESESGDDHYTESLVRLPNLAIYYTLSEVEPKVYQRGDLGLEQDDVVFWCCQSLYKYLPQHDDVFPRIAQMLSHSKFIFIRAPQSEHITEIFRQRLDTAFKQYGLDFRDFCRILPRLSIPEFAGATAIADIFLDSIGWSGCNTIMESTRFNLPIVTWPSELMRSRHALAILTRMNIHETVAASKDDYIQIAVRLGQDPSYRQAIANKIAEHKHKLYGDRESIEALQQFLIQTVKGNQ